MSKTIRLQPGDAAPISAAVAKAQSLVGRLVGERYRVEAILATHETGAVYRAQHVRLRKRVVLKVLHAGASAADRARLDREAIAGAHLSHPNVAAATDSGALEDGAQYVAIEHVPGTTLRQVVDQGPLPPGRTSRIARKLLTALCAVHERGIIHRDLEPRNVMITGEAGDDVKLIDFGRAKVDVEQLADGDDDAAAADLVEPRRVLTVAGVVAGTTAYLPPEAALGVDALDARSDLYALGVVLYEMLAGKRPFDAEEPGALFEQQRERDVPPIAERAPGVDVPRQLEAVVRFLCARDRDARYPTAAAALFALEAAQGSLHEAEIEAAAQQAADAPDTSGASPRPPGVPLLLGRAGVEGRGVQRALDVLADLWEAGRDRLAGALRAMDRAGVPRWVPGALVTAGTTLAIIVLLATGNGDEGAGASSDRAGYLAPRVVAVMSRHGGEATARDVAGEKRPAVAPAAESRAKSDDDADTAARRSRLRAFVEAEDWSRAGKSIETLADVDPAAFAEAAVVAAVVSTAVALESVGGEPADRVFDVLRRRLGARGIEILFEIVRSRGATKGSERAARILDEPDIVSLEPPALRIAFELVRASCSGKPALFARAAAEGDERSLTALRALREIRCPRRRKDPCCFSENEELAAAIKTLRERLGKGREPSK